MFMYIYIYDNINKRTIVLITYNNYSLITLVLIIYMYIITMTRAVPGRVASGRFALCGLRSIVLCYVTL